ncbi:MAG: hypothetical protein HYY13_09440 [Nitrospirae bacterium]|nr:hypothetical protein [Nitrospirota bacterium]
MRVVEFLVWLTDRDRIRHMHSVEKGRVVSFMLQYERHVRGAWCPVVRYDTAHGYAHKDEYGATGETTKTRLGKMSFDEALTYAEDDLRANWGEYGKAFAEVSDE